MSEYTYTIILEPDPEEGGYTVTVPALPGCVTQGETIEEAIVMAKDAIRLLGLIIFSLFLRYTMKDLVKNFR